MVLSQIWPTDPLGSRLLPAILLVKRAMIEFEGSHFEREVILWAVRWYVAYPISYRQEEMMAECGVKAEGVEKRWSDSAAIRMIPRDLRRQSRTAALTKATRRVPWGDQRMRCFLPILALAISSTHPSALELETGRLPW